MRFEEYVVERGQVLPRLAYVLTTDAQRSEDLTQTVLTEAYRRGRLAGGVPMTGARLLAAVAAVLVPGLAACAAASDAGTGAPTSATTRAPMPTPTGGDAAVWFLGSDNDLGPSSTGFTAQVSRLGCNNGVTGEPLEPNIRLTGSEVVVTFRVAPEQRGAAECPGNDRVPFEVALPEPLGERALVDGQCLAEGEAATTSHCDPDATRYPTS